MDKDNRDDFTSAKLRDLKLPVTFRISQLEAQRTPRPFSELLEKPELRFHGVQQPYVMSFKVAQSFKKDYIWNEWITLPIRYCDLPLSSQITFTVWDIAGPRAAIPVGGSTFRLFGKKWTLRRGKHRLLLWADKEADGLTETTTPSKVGTRDEMGRLEKLVKKKMAEVHASETEKSQSLYLYIDLPRFDFPVIFSEPDASSIPSTSTSVPAATQPPVPSASSAVATDTHIWAVVDPDIAKENPVEDKHRRLVRSHRSSPYDRELKPNAKIRDELSELVNYAPSQPLTSEEKDLIWKFRFYLTGIDWTETDIDDALELLGLGTVDSRVRAFAVKQLSRADDDELLLYLLQLIQALKSESAASDQRSARSTSSAISYDDSGLADFLIARAVRNLILGNRFYWYLMVEVALEDRVMAKMYGCVVYKFMGKIPEAENGVERRDVMRRQGELIETLSKRAKELRT
ncbi:Phosphatidylinositol (PI) 3-kinase [Steccherinum ochraceum]|uniref:Phosphatidylinositol (PI) 3-kinase n=1 Tax=Steccherinum ochraceum TaxID=92696 RepID=A0A4R0REV5_9APHY|nr:Phosphatidylinositol (PI) 3-kinase [Steccherinum ochraceum]